MALQNPPVGKGKLPMSAARTPTGSTVGGSSNQPQSLDSQGIESDGEEDEELVQARVKKRQHEGNTSYPQRDIKASLKPTQGSERRTDSREYTNALNKW